MEFLAALMAWLPHEPWALALALAALTLLVEDGAIAAGVALSAAGSIDATLALAAVIVGIAGGDLLLYCGGRWAERIGWLRRRLPGAQRLDRTRAALERHMVTTVVVARVVPGLRLVTYTAAGLLHLPFGRFALLVTLAVIVWTTLLFGLAGAAGRGLSAAFGLGPWGVAAALFILLAGFTVLAGRFARRAVA